MGTLFLYIVLEQNTSEERKRLYVALKKWFVGAIKTLFDKRYVHKQSIVWHGVQGIGKTPFVESLLPPEMQDFAGQLRNLNIENKDAKIALTKYLVMSIDEVDQFLKRAHNIYNIKSYMSTQKVDVRLPFGRTEVSRLRIASFMGTCNEKQFLVDKTGNQRFTVFSVKIFLNRKNGDGRYIEDFEMKNVWAYAYQLYRKGYSPCYTREEELVNEEVNQAYVVESDEGNTIRKFLRPAGKEDANSDDVKFMTTTQIRDYLNCELKLAHAAKKAARRNLIP